MRITIFYVFTMAVSLVVALPVRAILPFTSQNFGS